MAISAASVNFLPEELIWEVVSRLPSKPLIRFRYVSRSWYDIISKLLLSRKTQRLAILNWSFIRYKHKDVRLLVIDEEEDGKKAMREDGIDLYAILPCRSFPKTGDAKILGSYGSLVLLILDFTEIFLLNPSTLQHKKVLDSPIPIDDYHSPAGFCYDSVLDDYKVVIIVRRPFVAAYIATFKRKTWKPIRVQWHGNTLDVTTGTVVDEKIHWLVNSAQVGFRPVHNKIVAFHPAEDSFVELPIPEHPKYGDQGPPSSLHALGVLDGCLALSSWNERDNTTYIWVMKRYGVTSSWTSLFHIPAETTDLIFGRFDSRLLRPLFFTKQGKLLLELLFKRGKVVEYDMKRKSFKFIIHLPNSVITFEEGLSFPHDAYFWCEDKAATPSIWEEASSKRSIA